MLTQIKQANPDAVLALSYPPDSVLYAKQAKELGISASIQFIAIGPTEAFFAQVMGKSAEGIITIGHWMPRDEWKGSKAFYDAYKQKYNELPDYLDSALAYMSLESAGASGREGRTGPREDPPDDRLRDLRDHQRQGEVRRRAERHHADGLPAVPEWHAATGLAELLRLRESAPEEGLGLTHARLFISKHKVPPLRGKGRLPLRPIPLPTSPLKGEEPEALKGG